MNFVFFFIFYIFSYSVFAGCMPGGYVGDGRIIPHVEYENVKPTLYQGIQDEGKIGQTTICYHVFESNLGSESEIIQFSQALRVSKRDLPTVLKVNGKLKKKKNLKHVYDDFEDQDETETTGKKIKGGLVSQTWVAKNGDENCLVYQTKNSAFPGFLEIGKMCFKSELDFEKRKYLILYSHYDPKEETFLID